MLAVASAAIGREMQVRHSAPDAVDRRSVTATTEAKLWDMSPNMMATASLDGYLTRLNPAWEQTLGFSVEELTSRPYLDFVHPDDIDRTLDEAAALVNPAYRAVRFQNRYRTVDGSYRWLSWNCAAPEGDVVYAVAHDITETLRHEEVINELNRSLVAQAADLARSNRDLEQFAYVASHDLSEPLRSVSGYVQLLARRYRGRLDTDADEFIAFTVDGVARMQALIRDLLAYARAGQVGAAVKVDCAPLVAAVVDAARLTHPGAIFEVGPMPVVDSEEGPLRQVFDNLVSNALKFLAPERRPRVAVSSRPLDSAWEFTVADNGIGVEEHLRERIFGMYQRLHARTDYPGTGIGLAICQRVVERLGGCITVRSTFGEGSEFTFTIPRSVVQADGR